MSTVNPPPIPRLPPQWLSDPDIRAYQTAINKIIFQLWVNSPSGTLGTSEGGDSTTALISSLYQSLNDGLETYVSSTAANYTCLDGVNEFIRVTAACTITLSANPEDHEIKIIQPSGNFIVTVSGSINGGSSMIMNHAYDCMTVKYSVDLGGWVIV